MTTFFHLKLTNLKYNHFIRMAASPSLDSELSYVVLCSAEQSIGFVSWTVNQTLLEVSRLFYALLALQLY